MPIKISFVVLSLCASLLGASPAAAAASSSPRCDDLLIELGATQAALSDMERAVAEIDGDRDALRTEASTLAATIADRLRGGATEPEVRPLVERRTTALDQLERLDARIALLQGQLDALTVEVDRAERGYLVCVERSLEP